MHIAALPFRKLMFISDFNCTRDFSSGQIAIPGKGGRTMRPDEKYIKITFQETFFEIFL